MQTETEPNDGRPQKRLSILEISASTKTRQKVDIGPPPIWHPSSFCIAPISKPGLGPDQHEHCGHNAESSCSGNGKASDASSRITRNGESSIVQEQTDFQSELPQVIDLIAKGHGSGQSDVAYQGPIEENSTTHVETPGSNGRSSSSEPGPQSPESATPGRMSAGRPTPKPKTPLKPVRPSKVERRLPAPQQQPSSLPPGSSRDSTGRTPSEEDLYFLLLHRYRKREQIEKQLAARLRQLEIENINLDQTAQEYQQQLEDSTRSSSKQAAEIRAQKMVIDDIRNGYLKIKNYMTNLYEDQKLLKAKALSIDRGRQALQVEYDHFQHNFEQAKNTTTSSSNVINKVRTDLVELRQEAARLECSLHDAKLELRNAETLLGEERRRNIKYESHIAEVTRKQNNFSFTIQQGQQHLLNALKSIKAKLYSLETEQVRGASPPNLRALDQCVEMLRALTEIETASSGDVTDMIHVVQGLTERYVCSHKLG
jgi:hypothetical protein